MDPEVLLILLLAVGAFLFFKNQPTTTTSTASTPTPTSVTGGNVLAGTQYDSITITLTPASAAYLQACRSDGQSGLLILQQWCKSVGGTVSSDGLSCTFIGTLPSGATPTQILAQAAQQQGLSVHGNVITLNDTTASQIIPGCV